MRLGLTTAMIAAGLLAALPARAACQLRTIAELPVTMIGLRPTTTAKINGEEVRFVVDPGAFYSVISASSASALHLQTAPMSKGYTVEGTGGEAQTSVTTVKSFSIGGAVIPHIEFLVERYEPGSATVGLLGQNILNVSDIEYDYSHGMIRLLRSNDCGRRDLAYWARGEAVAALDVDAITPLAPHTIATVSVNGVKVRAMFVASSLSMLSTHAAARAGIKLDAPGVVDGGYTSGIGPHPVRTWVAPVKSFTVDDEKVNNTRLRVGDIGIETADMVIGADFFLSHRVYVSNLQHRMFFTYIGGPVFNLAQAPRVATTGTTSGQVSQTKTRDPTGDAEAFSRKGAVFSAQRDYSAAVAQFDQAVSLAPLEPRYLVQRAQARIDAKEPLQAIADIDAAIELKPSDAEVRMLRAQMRLRAHDLEGARVDLDAAAAALSKQSDDRLRLAGLYGADEQNEAAVNQYDLWLAAHFDDGRRATALNGRCFARAQLGHDLEKALADCNAALRLEPGVGSYLDSRGLVRLRRGDLAKAIADYDAALLARPKIAWSLYGRGVAKTKLGQTIDGASDIAAAAALAPALPARAKALGITP